VTTPEHVPAVPYLAVPSFAFAAQHDHVSLLPHDEVLEAIESTEADFANVFGHRNCFASMLVEAIERAAAGDCIGCKDVACRVSMLIEDLKAELGVDQ
jgi:hypothetical protein